jgi:predicted dehydrogenase
VLSVFQNSRWHGDFLTVQSILDRKLLGRVVACGMRFDRYRPAVQSGVWKEESGPGRGVLYNLGVHLIDQALVLFGWPRSLFADLRIQRVGGKVVDDFEVILDYGDLKVSLGASYLAREPGARFSLHGTEGSFVKYGTDPQEAMLKAGRSPLEEGWGLEPEEAWGLLHTGLEDLVFRGKLQTLRGYYPGYYDNIWAAIRQGAGLIVKPGEAKDAIRIIEAALQSQAQKRVIELGER